MGDVFIERMVKKKMESKDFLIIIGLLLAAFVLIAASVLFLTTYTGMMGPFFVLIGVCFGGYKLISMRNLEFEYSFTNGYMTVDKIMNRQSRKRLMAFECKNIEEIGEYEKNATRLKNREVQTRLFASEYGDGQGSWYVIVNAKKTGRTLLVFDPDEDLLEAVKKFIPASLRFEVFGRKK